MRKLAAFTLLEVTIAMLLISIVLGITYTAYRLVSRSYVTYAQKQERLATFLTADKLLRQDFLQAKGIVKLADGTAKGLELETPQGLITYQFAEAYLLRDQHALRIDTFKLAVKAPGLFFEGEPAEADGKVDQLHFETQLEGAALILNYKKLYSAQDLFD
ncbi:prepilin-type N-terminal cleavage/methylation domain-containing protein [Pedobacter sp. MC2016-14]|uniref:PulJ/GspJ family protein n=1 Tax=Pedobacter sp. MC2016-14 TaxID=2897327 RepID=UPI001E45A693|nr:prepilin-type N-terminal cleavage/methylation domain-containing protein [Pedobacter sp. MC2016-14]MCD0487360.1 prepilin-type N-terminal cleavage/methylation domain-containing protein [Pedobacter sp. MC2016-14]